MCSSCRTRTSLSMATGSIALTVDRVRWPRTQTIPLARTPSLSIGRCKSRVMETRLSSCVIACGSWQPRRSQLDARYAWTMRRGNRRIGRAPNLARPIGGPSECHRRSRRAQHRQCLITSRGCFAVAPSYPSSRFAMTIRRSRGRGRMAAMSGWRGSYRISCLELLSATRRPRSRYRGRWWQHMCLDARASNAPGVASVPPPTLNGNGTGCRSARTQSSSPGQARPPPLPRKSMAAPSNHAPLPPSLRRGTSRPLALQTRYPLSWAQREMRSLRPPPCYLTRLSWARQWLRPCHPIGVGQLTAATRTP